MKNKWMFLSLLSLILCSCQRGVYQPTETSEVSEVVVSTPFSVPTEVPVNAAKDLEVATPQPDWETLYTEANPVSDSEELIAILQDLYDRFMAQFDQPGWYRFPSASYYNRATLLGERVSWVQLNDPETGQFGGLLELWSHPEMYAPGFIFPAEVIGPDGRMGFTRMTETMDAYYFEIPDDIFLVKLDYEHTLDNLGFITNDLETGYGLFGHLDLLSTIKGIQNPVYDHGGAHRESSFEGWVTTYEDRPVFMLKTTEHLSGILPLTESGERPVRNETYEIFDLQNGGFIATKTDSWYQSGNSNMDEQWWMANHHLVERFDALPEQEQQIYDEALRRLDEFNQNGTS